MITVTLSGTGHTVQLEAEGTGRYQAFLVTDPTHARRRIGLLTGEGSRWTGETPRDPGPPVRARSRAGAARRLAERVLAPTNASELSAKTAEIRDAAPLARQ